MDRIKERAAAQLFKRMPALRDLRAAAAARVEKLKPSIDFIGYLSDREFEIFKLLSQGLRLKEISDRLCISIKTVSTHRTRLCTKINLYRQSDFIEIIFGVQNES